MAEAREKDGKKKNHQRNSVKTSQKLLDLSQPLNTWTPRQKDFISREVAPVLMVNAGKKKPS